MLKRAFFAYRPLSAAAYSVRYDEGYAPAATLPEDAQRLMRTVEHVIRAALPSPPAPPQVASPR